MDKFGKAGAALLLAGLLGTASAPSIAHHSFPATYSFVHVMAPDAKGNMVTWAVEWGAGSTLGASSISHDTLKPGDKVIVTGNPARDEGSHRLRMRAISRPSDGWSWNGTFG